MFIIINIQLPATMTVETLGKMSNAMSPFTFFNDMIDPRVGEQDHSRFSLRLVSVLWQSEHDDRTRDTKNKFSMRVVQRPYRDRRQNTLMLHMTGKTGLGLLNNVRMETGHSRFRSRPQNLRWNDKPGISEESVPEKVHDMNRMK